MTRTILDIIFDKPRNEVLNERDRKLLDWYLQVDNLARYFTISNYYIDRDDIHKQVKRVFPDWTGHEDYYWYCYHYEAFGNALYAYKEAWMGFLTELLNLQENIPDGKFLKQPGLKNKKVLEKNVTDIARRFITDPAIKKVLSDRHDSVHSFGIWRKSLSQYLTTQDYQSIRNLVMKDILATKSITEETHELLVAFVTEEYQRNN